MTNIPTFRTIKLELDDSIAWLKVNRPEKRNALNDAARAEIIEAVDWVSVNSGDARVLVLTGEGDEAFVAGADLDESAAGSVADQRAALAERRVYDAVAECAVPVIAMINGYCLGGGCELALSADIRVASEQALIGLPEINLAMMPGGGGTQRLPRLVGMGQAMRMILTGKPVDGAEAYRIGLVEILAPHDELESKTRALCVALKRHSGTALNLAKQAVRASQELPLGEGLAKERDLFCEAFSSEDKEEGLRAFREKRKPNFSNR
tara:strand:+ start:270 stop:1064 length:795 start_codon:yes stop_codon:yes gene_type:complete